jgi:hypothetical protein
VGEVKAAGLCIDSASTRHGRAAISGARCGGARSDNSDHSELRRETILGWAS